jgi:hypothetical protein
MDSRIGQLIRDGQTIYYAVLQGRTFEHADIKAVEFQLEVADHQLQAEAAKPAKSWSIEVQKQGRGWGVFGIAGDTQELIEGGFFSRAAAESCRDRWERECLQDEVEKAERAAGWDPNP